MFNYVSLSSEQCDFIEIASQDDLPPGERLFLEIDGENIVILNIAGLLYAIGDVCSHDNGPLGEGELDGNEIVCPRHGARFDIRNGKVTALPAVEDIPAYPVRVVNGSIEVGIPRK
jgi:3-phenylpropionate/trans-cinnamate dioxygenase ferredoxin subunit